MEKKKKKLIKKLSLENNIPIENVEEITNSQFEMVKDIISSADIRDLSTFKSIRLINFGCFTVRKNLKKAQKNSKIINKQ